MAKLSNINGRFAVEDDGAIQFNGQAGTDGYVLESRGDSAPPVWTDRDTGRITGSGAANRVTYWTGTYSISSDDDFRFNGTNVSIGVAPASSRRLLIKGLGTDATTASFQVNDGNNVDVFLIKDDKSASFTGLVSGITPTAAANFTTKAYVDALDPKGGPYLPLAGGTMNSGAAIGFVVASAGGNFINITHTGNEAWSIGAQNGTGVDDYLDIGIDGGTRAMSWHETGKVGIGTNSPNSYDGESNNLVVASGVDGAVPTPGITIACLGDTATTGRGALRFADGTSSNAPYRGALEYNHDGDDMFFRTSGTIKMTLDTGGNLGIGVTSPGSRLTVNKTKSGTGVENYDLIRLGLLGTGAVGDSSTIGWFSTSGTKTAGIEGISGLDNILYGELAFHVRRYTTDSYDRVMTINNRGNVGIGTDSPSTPLMVNRASNSNEPGIYYDVTGGGSGSVGIGSTAAFGPFIVGNTLPNGNVRGAYSASRMLFNGGGFSFQTSDETSGARTFDDKVKILINGNVGIGMTLPSFKLDALLNDAATNTLADVIRVSHTTTGTPATGLGAGIQFSVERVSSSVNLSRAAIYGVSGPEEANQGDFIVHTRTDTGVNDPTSGMNEKFRITARGNIGQAVLPITDPYITAGDDAEQWQTYQIGKAGVFGAYKKNNESMFGFNTYVAAPSGSNKAIVFALDATATRYYADRISFHHLSTTAATGIQTQTEKMRITSDGKIIANGASPGGFYLDGANRRFYGNGGGGTDWRGVEVSPSGLWSWGETGIGNYFSRDMGIGVVPTITGMAGNIRVLQIGQRGVFSAYTNSGNVYMSCNVRVLSNGNNVAITSGVAGQYRIADDQHVWYSAVTANAGAVQSLVITAKIDNAGTFTAKGDVVAYGSPSDKRLKENIKPIKSALEKVSKLQGVTFNWKKSDSILDIKEDIGFIAQDVQKVIPELVRENDNGMLSMRHQGIAPILLEAIKELKAEIEELKSNKCNCNK